MWTQGKTVAELRQYAANENISKQARAQALREIGRRIDRGLSRGHKAREAGQ